MSRFASYVVCSIVTVAFALPPPSAATPSRTKVRNINILFSGLVALFAGRRHRQRPPLKDFAIGAAGGALVFNAKRRIGENAANPATLDRIHLFEKLMVDTGSSLVENVAKGVDPLYGIYVPFGPVHLSFYFRERHRPRLRLLPGTAAFALWAMTDKDARPEWKLTARTGAFVLSTDKGLSGGLSGRAFANGVLLKNGSPPDLLPHEIIHVFQWRQTSVTGSLLRLFPEKAWWPDPNGESWIFFDGAGFAPFLVERLRSHDSRWNEREIDALLDSDLSFSLPP